MDNETAPSHHEVKKAGTHMNYWLLGLLVLVAFIAFVMSIINFTHHNADNNDAAIATLQTDVAALELDATNARTIQTATSTVATAVSQDVVVSYVQDGTYLVQWGSYNPGLTDPDTIQMTFAVAFANSDYSVVCIC